MLGLPRRRAAAAAPRRLHPRQFSRCHAAHGFCAPRVYNTFKARAPPYAHPFYCFALAFEQGGPKYKMDAEAGEVAEVPFEVRFSIGNVVSVSGAILFVFCIFKFLLNNGESDIVSTFGFVYAIPALVGGQALKYAELPPVNPTRAHRRRACARARRRRSSRRSSPTRRASPMATCTWRIP